MKTAAKKTVKLILRAHSNDENYDAGVECAFVELTPQLARLMLRRLTTFVACEKKDGSLSEMRWMSDEYVDWIGRQVDDVDVRLPDAIVGAIDKLASESYVLLPSNCPLPEDVVRTECNEMLIEDWRGVAFTCLIRHVETRITSEKIPLAVIAKAAGVA